MLVDTFVKWLWRLSQQTLDKIEKRYKSMGSSSSDAVLLGFPDQNWNYLHFFKGRTVNPTALCSDQNLSFVSGRWLKKALQWIFSLRSMVLCNGTSPTPPNKGRVHFSTLWNLGCTCDLLWPVDSSRIDIPRFKKPFKKPFAFTQRETYLPCKEAQRIHMEREATRRKQTLRKAERSGPHWARPKFQSLRIKEQKWLLFYVTKNWGVLFVMQQ